MLGPVHLLGFTAIEVRTLPSLLVDLCIAQAENKSWRAEMRKYLTVYRRKQGLKCFSLRVNMCQTFYLTVLNFYIMGQLKTQSANCRLDVKLTSC